MLKRKIEDVLLRWKQTPERKPLVLKGCRQCGKTFSVLKFAREQYANTVYINFFQDPEYQKIFAGSLDVDHLIMMMSAAGVGAAFEPGKTVIVLDEIQECPEARTALKFFKTDGRFDVIATGSLLGVAGYGKKPQSVPVGYEDIEQMYPLDFEEFLWAAGIDENLIGILKHCQAQEEQVPAALHGRLRELLTQYAVVGGMPEVVEIFFKTRNMASVLGAQKSILASYTDDMCKYAPARDEKCIRDCFNSIPAQLAKSNPKFQYAQVRKGGRSSEFVGILQWMQDAGVIERCFNLLLPELPLSGNADLSNFRVYLSDPGLFAAMLGEGTQFDILSGQLFGYKGPIFENLVAGMLAKTGRRLYFFEKQQNRLEVDFVIKWKGRTALLEAKASQGKTRSTTTILRHPEKYHVEQAIKLGDYQIGRSGNILTLPMYMTFLLKVDQPDVLPVSEAEQLFRSELKNLTAQAERLKTEV